MVRNSIHLLVLYNFAVILPTIQKINPDPLFLVYKGLDGLDVFLILLALSVPIPLCLWLGEAIAAKIHPKLYQGVHLLLIGVLLVVILLPLFNTILAFPGGIAILLSLLFGITGTLAYCKRQAPQMFLETLSPVIIVFPLIFLLVSPASQLLFPPRVQSVFQNPRLENTPPIVLVVFDELPLSTLLDTTGEIDSLAFPNLAGFSKQAYWFQNNFSVASYTHLAIPSILSGRLPDHDKLSIYANYPQNLFTFLAEHYDVLSGEQWTRLCPNPNLYSNPRFSRADRVLSVLNYNIRTALQYSIAPRNFSLSPLSQEDNASDVFKSTWPSEDRRNGAAKTATLQSGWRQKLKALKPPKNVNSDRVTPYQTFKRRAATSHSKPPFYFLHIVLPHKPLIYLPNGQYYALDEDRNVDSKTDPIPGLMDYHRHILQTRYSDAIFGDFMGFLKNEGLYDKALIIFTADHGNNFDLKAPPRKAQLENLEETLRVPLFIKLPNQKKGIQDIRIAQHTDIVPTILDVLNARQYWKTARSSLLQPAPNKQKNIQYVSIPQDYPTKHLAFSYRPVALQKLAARKYDHFSVLPHGDLIPRNPYNALIGHSVLAARGDNPNTELSITLKTPRHFFQNVDLKADFLPALLNGAVYSKHLIPQRLQVAVALNGKIVAVASSFQPAGKSAPFSIMLPYQAFRNGGNDVRFFQVKGSALFPTLHEIRQIQ